MTCKSSAVHNTTPRPAYPTDVASDILRFAVESFDSGHGVALATLTGIDGGSARPLGAQMAVRSDGLYCGLISGGCTESAVAAEAMTAIKMCTDTVVRFGKGSPFFDIVLPCGGGISVAIHVLRRSDALHDVLDALEQRKRVVLSYSPGSQSISLHSAQWPSGWQDDVFDVRYRPRTRVVLYGRSIEFMVTSALARAAEYEVFSDFSGVSDPSAMIDRDTAVAILFHDLELEVPFLAAALARKPFYLGALGSKRTHEKRIHRLRHLGFEDGDLAAIKAPIGMFNQARNARALAISVLADIANSDAAVDRS